MGDKKRTTPTVISEKGLMIPGDIYYKMIDEVEDYAIILLDLEGFIQNWNRGAEKIKQYSKDEAIGMNFAQFYLPKDRSTGLPEKMLEEAKTQGRIIHEGWRLRKDGTRFWGRYTLTALHGELGKIIGYSELTRDFTERKEAEEKFKEYTLSLEKSNEELRKSEERYHRMIAEIQDYAIILLNEKGDIQNWNAGAQKIKGYNAEEIVGKNFRTFYLPEDRKAGLPETLITEAAERGKAIHEGWRVRKNGSRFWGSIVITALHDDKGEIIGFSKVTRDLTERKLAEDQLQKVADELLTKNEQLRKSEERYHRMIAEIQDYAIILLNEKGDIQNWNAGAQKIKGYNAEEIIGKNFKTFYLPEDQKSGLPEKLITEAAERGKATHEGWRVRKNGTRFWGSIVITALHNDNGEIIGFSKVTRDLTERKLAEDKMHLYLAELEAQNRELERFAYIASHDLQEPLRKIRIFIDIIRTDINDKELIGKFFDKISASAERMSDLIRSILNYSRLGKEDEAMVYIDLNILLKTVLDDFEVTIQEKTATISSEVLPPIRGITLQINQVFSNLIGNALKFSDKKPEIKISSTVIESEQISERPANLQEGKYLEIIFADNGIGFEQQYGKQIFSLFQRLHAKDTYVGTGIGLALCKRIMENHNGFIQAWGVPGKGSQFHLYFPIQKQ
ncbi:MAG: PAS domain S-box protein [Bacteroidota bacterium]|nr:PAS domain S-box protein [Bacteroidota bacterium]